MPFLDTRVKLCSDGLKSTVYRKKTNTNVVLHHDSIAPTTWKIGLMKWFLHRAEIVCSDEKTFNEEIDKLKTIFSQNGYPVKYFEKVIREFKIKKNKQKNSTQNEIVNERENNTDIKTLDNHRKLVFKIPYVGKISEMYGRRIRKLMKTMDCDIRVVYETTKVKDAFQIKDSVPKELQARVVYEFTCRGDPDIHYIGHTNRNFRERYLEHLRGGSAISDHIAQCHECENKGVTMSDFKMLKQCRQKKDTMKFEALFIKERDPVLNRQLVKPGGKQYTLLVYD